MVKWIVLAMLASSVAHANEIASDPPPPPPPPPPLVIVDRPRPPDAKPLPRSVGFRFGVMNTALDGHERSLIMFGAQWNVRLARRLHAVAEYDYVMVFGDEPDPMVQVRGHGHDLRGGGRLTILDTTIRDDGKLYADFEATGGMGYVSDNIVGPQWLPNVLVGARLGYELWSHEPKSQSSMFGANVLIGAMLTPGDVGFTFQIGMEWGRNTKH